MQVNGGFASDIKVSGLPRFSHLRTGSFWPQPDPGPGCDDRAPAGGGDNQALGLQGADDLTGGLHGNTPALHHLSLRRDALALGEHARGDLGADLGDCLHV